MFGEQAVHDGGTLHYESSNVLQQDRETDAVNKAGYRKKIRRNELNYQRQVIMRSLLLHWCMLGEVDEIGTDGLWVCFHVNSLKKSEQTLIITAGDVHDSLMRWDELTCCRAVDVMPLTLSNKGSFGRSCRSHWYPGRSSASAESSSMG